MIKKINFFKHGQDVKIAICNVVLLLHKIAIAIQLRLISPTLKISCAEAIYNLINHAKSFPKQVVTCMQQEAMLNHQSQASLIKCLVFELFL